MADAEAALRMLDDMLLEDKENMDPHGQAIARSRVEKSKKAGEIKALTRKALSELQCIPSQEQAALAFSTATSDVKVVKGRQERPALSALRFR